MKTNFKKEWTPEDFKTAKKYIAKFLNSRYFETHHSPDATPFCNCKSFNDYDYVLGLAYTSSSDFAGLWICNTELFLDTDHIYKLNGFVLGSGGFVFAVWNDNKENEIIFPIN